MQQWSATLRNSIVTEQQLDKLMQFWLPGSTVGARFCRVLVRQLGSQTADESRLPILSCKLKVIMQATKFMWEQVSVD